MAARTTRRPACARAMGLEELRTQGIALIDQLADYLAQAQAGQLPVLPSGTPQELQARWPAQIRRHARRGSLTPLPRILAESKPPAPPALHRPSE